MQPPLGKRLPAADPAFRPANGLSTAGVDKMWNHLVAAGHLRQVRVTTRGRPPVTAWASYLRQGQGSYSR